MLKSLVATLCVNAHVSVLGGPASESGGLTNVRSGSGGLTKVRSGSAVPVDAGFAEMSKQKELEPWEEDFPQMSGEEEVQVVGLRGEGLESGRNMLLFLREMNLMVLGKLPDCMVNGS